MFGCEIQKKVAGNSRSLFIMSRQTSSTGFWTIAALAGAGIAVLGLLGYALGPNEPQTHRERSRGPSGGKQVRIGVYSYCTMRLIIFPPASFSCQSFVLRCFLSVFLWSSNIK
jgi:preprotein translocase subunit Sss1